METEKPPRERASELIRLLVPEWHLTTRQGLWAIRITLILGLLVAIGYAYDVKLWDWLKLLIVPAVIAGGGIWFNQQQRKRELEVEAQRTQDDALQAYLDQMSELMLLKPAEDMLYKVQNLAQARTLTVLQRLGPKGKRTVLEFLYEAHMIQHPPFFIRLGSPDTMYSAADLSEADLRGAFLKGIDLGGPMTGANLSGANLRNADLEYANMEHAILRDANLSGANLSGATISGVDLNGADTSGAKGVIAEMLERQASSLKGAIMPNGQKYEEWLKDKESGGENGEKE